MIRNPDAFRMALLTLTITVWSPSSTAGTARAFPAEPGALDEVTGTYVDASLAGECDIRATSGGGSAATRAMTVVYRRGLLTLRVVPTQTVRVLHVQKRPRSTASPSPSPDDHNGLARWEEGVLVVESAVPALPLWTKPAMPIGASTLIERFAFADSSLTYRAAYRGLDGEPIGSGRIEMTLTKCGVTHAN